MLALYCHFAFFTLCIICVTIQQSSALNISNLQLGY